MNRQRSSRSTHTRAQAVGKINGRASQRTVGGTNRHRSSRCHRSARNTNLSRPGCYGVGGANFSRPGCHPGIGEMIRHRSGFCGEGGGLVMPYGRSGYGCYGPSGAAGGNRSIGRRTWWNQSHPSWIESGQE